MHLTVADFERQLGHARPADIDVAAKTQDAATEDEPEDLVIAPTNERPSCWVRLKAETRERWVTVFRFDD
jgi:hypothetical protein